MIDLAFVLLGLAAVCFGCRTIDHHIDTVDELSKLSTDHERGPRPGPIGD